MTSEEGEREGLRTDTGRPWEEQREASAGQGGASPGTEPAGTLAVGSQPPEPGERDVVVLCPGT